MIFHLGTEIPAPVADVLDHEVPGLTPAEERILRTQIRKNNRLIAEYVGRLDLLLNREGYPVTALFIHRIRRRLDLLMEENDTFRKVLWKSDCGADLAKRKSP
jgi:hypothetical protein